MDKGLIAAYRMTRQRLARKGFANSPARCLEMARADLARAGHSNFTFYAMSDGAGAPGERGGRWIERPEAFGLRFVGFSDELRDGGRNSHSGWFLYPDGDPCEVARGCVYQLPARNGRPVYVEALRTGETLGRRTEWRDMSEDGSALLFFGSLHYGDKGGDEYSRTSDCSDAVKDAARGADREAEIYAERERDYQEAWQAGSRCADLETEAKEGRADARGLVRELRQHLNAGGRLGERMCATLRGAIRSHIRDASRAAIKARELREQWGDSEPFAEGLGQ